MNKGRQSELLLNRSEAKNRMLGAILKTFHRALVYFVRRFTHAGFLFFIIFLCSSFSFARSSNLHNLDEYEGRVVTTVELVFDGSTPDPSEQAEFLSLIRIAANTEFSSVRVRDSLQALFDSGRVANARVEVVENSNHSGPLRVRFIVQRQVQIGDVRLDLGPYTGSTISTDEIRARMNLTQPGSRLTEQAILRNADEIQIYLRDRGYFNASVEPQSVINADRTRATVTYKITPGEQARVSSFDVQINGFNATTVAPTLTLQKTSLFTRDALAADVSTIRNALVAQGYLSPILSDPGVVRDPETNRVAITLKGQVGPHVIVSVKNYEISEKKQRELLPVKREGNIDISAIVEGERRLRNKLQEQGYFFAEVNETCTVSNPPTTLQSNGTADTCQNLNPESLTTHTVEIDYAVDLGRRYKLKEIRITGTNKLTYSDVAADLKSQQLNALGLVPFLGYGRGYTSVTLLEQDKRTLAAFMRDLGYRHATVNVLQGVSIASEDLIITFDITEGPLTRIAGVEVKGNNIYSEKEVKDQLKTVLDAPFSRSQARAAAERVTTLYARNGYIDAHVDLSVVELPKKGNDEQVKLIYSISGEGDKVFINRIVVNGVTGTPKSQETKRNAILRAVPLRTGDILRSDHLSDAERELYLTDAYAQVLIRTEDAGEDASGFKHRDVVIDVEEKKRRVMDYGGGYSTDTGALGLFEISNVNLMDKLHQAAIRVRASQRQQLVRFEYLDPRFARFGSDFAPLAISVEYQRDSTITRFFRSAIDRGTQGIVQRLDENGNPINIFGEQVAEPTINRFTASIETRRILSQKTHTIVFGRYSYEDVRLFNLESLVVQPILQPDSKIRLSKLGASIVRDTRERCERGLPGQVDQYRQDEEPGAPGEVCRYNQVDATRGDFFNADYALALRQLGGNISYNRFQATYRRYYKANSLRRTVFAGNVILGLSNLFNPIDRDNNGTIDEIDRTLPISERFFSGGSTTLRGFNFEEAGPREVVIPEGEFRDQNNNVVFLNPFTVPVGGNALAVVNLEARVPITKSTQIVPFYDGGNVFRRVGDLFGKSDTTVTPPTNLIGAINAFNLKAHWSHTVGLGFRVTTPFGGAFAVDYGFLLNPPEFLIPQRGPNGVDFNGTPAIFRLNNGRLHFRITQTF